MRVVALYATVEATVTPPLRVSVKLVVVIVDVSMSREKAAVTVVVTGTPVAPGVGVCAVTVGGSIVQVLVAGVASWLPAGSVALTAKVWLPAASGPAYACGLVHGAKTPT